MTPTTRFVPHLSINSQAGWFFLLFFFSWNTSKRRTKTGRGIIFPFHLSPGSGRWKNWNNSRKVYTAGEKESCWWRRRTWTTRNIFFFHCSLKQPIWQLKKKKLNKNNILLFDLLSAVVRQANTTWSNRILQQTLFEDPLWQIYRNRKTTRSDLFSDNCHSMFHFSLVVKVIEFWGVRSASGE